MWYINIRRVAKGKMNVIAKRDRNFCKNCHWCENLISCPTGFRVNDCIGCKACSLACPYNAIEMVEAKKETQYGYPEIEIEVDGKKFKVPAKTTVKETLQRLGYEIFAPCQVGGCYSCAVEIDGKEKPTCITAIKEGMRIKTDFSQNFAIKRIVGGFMGHSVGGVGTPWYLKKRGYIEVAVFSAGCNFRCPQCQNWTTAYRGKEDFDHQALTPKETAEIMTITRRRFGVNRMAISGGECTLNRKWLVEYLKELKKLNPDEEARLHVDTNGSLLTPEYLDELIEAGMTDIGIDLKGLKTETFMRVTGLENRNLAEIYKETAWQAVKYLVEKYTNKVFLGIGIPYNSDFISLEEIETIGKEIYKINPNIQVCPLDYRPEFKKMDISRPSYLEMRKVYDVLKSTGLKTVICQTAYGYIGP